MSINSIHCQHCESVQPKEWKAGDLCNNCGSSVREEVRCAWCAKLTPKGNFCKHCGNQVQPDRLYPAARMLKSLGVDQLQLTEKLGEINDAQLQNYERLYNKQLAEVYRRVDEVRLAEKYLVLKHYSSRLENDLVVQLPMNEAQLEELSQGPMLQLENNPEALSKVIEHSSLTFCRDLAVLASFYRQDQPLPFIGNIDLNTFLPEHIQNNTFLAQEAALLLGSAKSMTVDLKSDWMFQHVAKIEDLLTPLLNVPRVQQYAALALLRLHRDTAHPFTQTNLERLKELAEDALRSNIAEVQLSAATLLQHDEVLVNFITTESTSLPHWQEQFAIQQLIQNRSAVLTRVKDSQGILPLQIILGICETVYALVIPEAWMPALEAYLSSSSIDFNQSPHKELSSILVSKILTHSRVETKEAASMLSKVALQQNKPEWLIHILSNSDELIEESQQILHALCEHPFDKAYLYPLSEAVSHYSITPKVLKWLFTYIVKERGALAFAADFRDKGYLERIFNGVLKQGDIASYHLTWFLLEQASYGEMHFHAKWIGMYLNNHFHHSELCYQLEAGTTPKNYRFSQGFLQDFYQGNLKAFLQAYVKAMQLKVPLRKVFQELIELDKVYFADLLSQDKEACIYFASELIDFYPVDNQEHLIHELFNLSNSSGKQPLVEVLAFTRINPTTVKILSNLYQHTCKFSPALTQQWVKTLTDHRDKIAHDLHFRSDVQSVLRNQKQAEGTHFYTLHQFLFSVLVNPNSPEEEQAFFSIFQDIVDADPQYLFTDGQVYTLDFHGLYTHIFSDLKHLLEVFGSLLTHQNNYQILHYLVEEAVKVRDELPNISEALECMPSLQILPGNIVLYLKKHTSGIETQEQFRIKPIMQLLQATCIYSHQKEGVFQELWKLDLSFDLNSEIARDVLTRLLEVLIQEKPQVWLFQIYTYLEDYFFNDRGNVSWLPDFLESQCERIATLLQEQEDLTAKIGNILFNELKKSEKEYTNHGSYFKFLKDHVIQLFGKSPWRQSFANYLQTLIDNDEISFFLKSDLETFIEESNATISEEEEQETADITDEDSIDTGDYFLGYDESEIFWSLEEAQEKFATDDFTFRQFCDHLPYYKKERKDNPVLLDFLLEKSDTLQEEFTQNMGLPVLLLQALCNIIMDPATAPDGIFPQYGTKAREAFLHFGKGSIYAMHYKSTFVMLMQSTPNLTDTHKAVITEVMANI
ncbi:zinc ribbon domain-containing protein [Rapidithrix thailandica]|uniref:Zinc ribbon domain-containing protein n=1 Tax=Rapidithrix thailandica TaxID=413964 RepID=A0AAW9RTR4_9BACT